MFEEFKKLVEASESILITSHIGPDGDSVSSSLLLYEILRKNYPDKDICVCMEEKPFGLDFLSGFEAIKFQALEKALKNTDPDLLIVLDGNALHRLTRDPKTCEDYLQKSDTKIAVIDHHEGMEFTKIDLYINQQSPAVALDVYDIFIERLGLKKPAGYAQTALTGIYTDTGGFVYGSGNFNLIFEVIPKLIADGADVQELAIQLNVITEKAYEVLSELMANTHFEDDFVYSYISDQTATEENHEAIVQATDLFRYRFIRNIKGRVWGFVVYRDVLVSGIYSASFRAQSGRKDVSKIARELGGGGHKPSASAKIQAKSVEQALEIVKKAIVK